MKPMTKNDLLFFIVLIMIFCLVGLAIKGEMKSNQEKPETDNGTTTLEDDSIEFTKTPFVFD